MRIGNWHRRDLSDGKTWFAGLSENYWPLLILFIGGPGVEAQKKDNARVMGLVELYGISASIIYGEEDEFAANLLLEILETSTGRHQNFPSQRKQGS